MEDETATNPAETQGVEALTDDELQNVHPDDRPEVNEPDEGTGDTADTSETGDVTQEDEEEIEHNGKKYKLPKTLAAERMMQADYTKKTTELAEQRKAWEASRSQANADDETTREAYGKVHALREQMKLFDTVDWQGLNTADPVEAQSLWFEREQAKSTLQSLEGELQKQGETRLQSQRAELATAMQETGAVLSRDIKGWSPQLANDIAAYGVKEFGIKPAEVQEMADPRVWKALHRAMTAEAALKSKTAGERQATIQKVAPAKVVTAKAAPATTGLDDRLSSVEWHRRRNAELAAAR